MPRSAREIRVRKHTKSRAETIRMKENCPVCGLPGDVVHHVIPIRFGGSYGKYNLMAAHKKACHSRLNKISNRWSKRNKDLIESNGLQASRLCRRHMMKSIKDAAIKRKRRADERELQEKGVEELQRRGTPQTKPCGSGIGLED